MCAATARSSLEAHTTRPAVGLAITGYRLLRGERFSLAAGGLLGLAVAIGIVALTGSARDFFVVGIWVYLAAFVVTLGSVLARRPLSGLVFGLTAPGPLIAPEPLVVDDLRHLRLAERSLVMACSTRSAGGRPPGSRR